MTLRKSTATAVLQSILHTPANLITEDILVQFQSLLQQQQQQKNSTKEVRQWWNTTHTEFTAILDILLHDDIISTLRSDIIVLLLDTSSSAADDDVATIIIPEGTISHIVKLYGLDENVSQALVRHVYYSNNNSNTKKNNNSQSYSNRSREQFITSLIGSLHHQKLSRSSSSSSSMYTLHLLSYIIEYMHHHNNVQVKMMNHHANSVDMDADDEYRNEVKMVCEANALSVFQCCTSQILRDVIVRAYQDDPRMVMDVLVGMRRLVPDALEFALKNASRSRSIITQCENEDVSENEDVWQCIFNDLYNNTNGRDNVSSKHNNPFLHTTNNSSSSRSSSSLSNDKNNNCASASARAKASYSRVRKASAHIEPYRMTGQDECDTILSKIHADLSNAKADFWKARYDALVLLRRIIIGGIVTSNDDDDDEAPYQTTFLHYLQQFPIVDQILDLRSQITRAACDVLMDLSYLLRHMNTNVNANTPMIRTWVESCVPHLLKLSTNGIKVMALQGVECIRHVMCYTPMSRLVSILCDGCRISKHHPKYKQCCALSLSIALRIWPIHTLDKYLTNSNGIIRQALCAAMCDRDPDVREAGRGMYWALHSRALHMAEAVWSTLDGTTQGRLKKCKDLHCKDWVDGGKMNMICHGLYNVEGANSSSGGGGGVKRDTKKIDRVNRNSAGTRSRRHMSRVPSASTSNKNQSDRVADADKPWRRRRPTNASSSNVAKHRSISLAPRDSSSSAAQNVDIVKTPSSLSRNPSNSSTQHGTAVSASSASTNTRRHNPLPNANISANANTSNSIHAPPQRRRSTLPTYQYHHQQRDASSATSTLTLQQFLRKTSDPLWSIREQVFLDLTEHIRSSAEVSSSFLANPTSTLQFSLVLCKHMTDHHHRVSRAALDACRTCFTIPHCHNVLGTVQYLTSIVPAIIHSAQKPVLQEAVQQCIRQVCDVIPGDVLMSSVLQSLRGGNTGGTTPPLNDRIICALLEVLSSAVINITTLVASSDHVRGVLEGIAMILLDTPSTTVRLAVDDVLCQLFDSVDEEIFALVFLDLSRDKYLILEKEISCSTVCQGMQDAIASAQFLTTSPRSSSSTHVTDSASPDVSIEIPSTTSSKNSTSTGSSKSTGTSPLRDISILQNTTHTSMMSYISPPEHHHKTPMKHTSIHTPAPSTDPVLKYMVRPPMMMSIEKNKTSSSYPDLHSVLMRLKSSNGTFYNSDNEEELYFAIQSLIRLLKVEEQHCEIDGITSCLLGKKNIRYDEIIICPPYIFSSLCVAGLRLMCQQVELEHDVESHSSMIQLYLHGIRAIMKYKPKTLLVFNVDEIISGLIQVSTICNILNFII